MDKGYWAWRHWAWGHWQLGMSVGSVGRGGSLGSVGCRSPVLPFLPPLPPERRTPRLWLCSLGKAVICVFIFNLQVYKWQKAPLGLDFFRGDFSI